MHMCCFSWLFWSVSPLGTFCLLMGNVCPHSSATRLSRPLSLVTVVAGPLVSFQLGLGAGGSSELLESGGMF